MLSLHLMMGDIYKWFEENLGVILNKSLIHA